MAADPTAPPSCASCCGPADNLTGIRPHQAQSFFYCHACWLAMSEADRGMVRTCLEALTMLGAAVLETTPADWLVESDEAELRGLLLAPEAMRAIAAWVESTPAHMRAAIRRAIKASAAQRPSASR